MKHLTYPAVMAAFLSTGLSAQPVFSKQPPSRFSICKGKPTPPTLFTVAATGATSYAWQELRPFAPFFTPIGQTGTTLTPFWKTPPGYPIRTVRCVANGPGGSTNSSTCLIIIGDPSCAPPIVTRIVGVADALVAMPGGHLLMGDPKAGNGAILQSGRVVVRSPNGSTWTVWGRSSGHNFGTSIAYGKVDKTIGTDIFVGAPGYTNASGAVYRIHRFDKPPVLYLTDPLATHFGSRVACAQYLDNDGYSDLLVASKTHVYAYSGHTGTQLWKKAAPAGVSIRALAVLGDINGDGYDDVACGIPAYSQGRGRVEVRSGVFPGLIRAHVGLAIGEAMGEQVAGLGGDIDGDGVNDYVTSSPNQLNYSGAVSFWSGKTGTLLARRFGPRPGLRYGASLSCGGDGNNDGYPDVLVGSDPTTAAAGITELISGIDRTVIRSRTGGRTFGRRVASVDTSNDGQVDDVVAEKASRVVWVFSRARSSAVLSGSRVYGRICPNSRRQLARASISGASIIGQTVQWRLDSARPHSQTFLTMGGDYYSPPWSGLFNMPGCGWHNPADLIVAMFTDASGQVRLPVRIPNDPRMVGGVMMFQFVTKDSGLPANRLPFVTSNGVVFGIGAQ